MIVEPHASEGILLCTSNVHSDSRGSFKEIYNLEVLRKLGGEKFVQQNLVRSGKNVIRGMHWQSHPYMQAKLITVISGEIIDVFVDLRPGSKSFNSAFEVKLNSSESRSIFIPRGFAHGYQSLTEDTVVSYSVTKSYSPISENRINPLSSEFKNFWVSPFILGNDDEKAPFFNSKISYL